MQANAAYIPSYIQASPYGQAFALYTKIVPSTRSVTADLRKELSDW